MTHFAALIDRMTAGKAGLTLSIPDNWKQGRTLYGGLTTGLCYAAAQHQLNGLPPLRSCQISFVGPVTDDPHLTAHILRQGRNVSAVQVEMKIDPPSDESKTVAPKTVTPKTVTPKTVAMANMLFGLSRASKLTVNYPAPMANAPEEVPHFFPKAVEGFVPAFTKNFDIRLIEGERPMSGSERGYIRVWARHKDESSRHGMASFLTLGDVLPPAALPMFKQMGPVSSMNWQINILEDHLETEDGWWQIETKLTSSKGGYSSQIMRYWNSAGILCAEATQSVTIFI